MQVSDYQYDLPPDRIAQVPLEPRDSARLLVYDRKDASIAHRKFTDLAQYIQAGDALVLNQTRVMPARLIGRKKGSGGAMEFLLLKRLEENHWEVLVKPGRRAKPGTTFLFGDTLSAVVGKTTPQGGREVEFFYEGIWEEVLASLGEMPLPPYIRETLQDKERYQTVYAKEEGSAAAPTAGLHFTPSLLEQIKKKGVDVVPILLHVGLGTFRPVSAQSIEEHVMHSEYWQVSQEAASRIEAAKQGGGRVFCVGTTTVRTLETAAQTGTLKAGSGFTSIFLHPGAPIRMTDALITNFHLPQSTLLMLVSALMGREEALRVYNIAVEENYRFFSFGDAMLIL